MPYMDLMEKYRIVQTLPCIKGRLLDVGCGYNNLVAAYSSGVGVDVYPWPGIDVLIDNAAHLPFEDKSFDTVTMLAALNHIPNRAQVLSEIKRVLSDAGILLITMISPWVGAVAHIVFRKDEATRSKLLPGELNGMTRKHIYMELRNNGFKIIKETPFGLNHLYLARKAGDKSFAIE